MFTFKRFTFKRKLVRAIAGATAVTALSLSAFAGVTPAAHAVSTHAAPARIVPPCSTPTNPDCGEHLPGQYPAGDYGPSGACCYGQSGTWFDGGGVGLIGKEVWTYANGATQDSYAGWNPAGLTPSTRYYVAAYIPDNHATAKAQYTVHALGGAQSVTIDQSQYTNAWVPLGCFFPDSQGHIVVNLSDAGDSYPQEVGADAMHFESVGSCPTTTPGGNGGGATPPATMGRQWDDPANFDNPNAPDYGIYWVRCGTCRRDGKSDELPSTTPNLGTDYYNPGAPTVIYVHGWEADSTQNGYRESMLSPLVPGIIKPAMPLTMSGPVDMATAWKDKGYNVGIFYWNQFADEGGLNVDVAQEKIWLSDHMTWHYRNAPHRSVERPAYTGHGSVADLFVNAYVQAMRNYQGTNVRIVGHSLGNQLAVRMTYLLAKNWIDTGKVSRNLLPQRVALLDPFYTPPVILPLCGPAFGLQENQCEGAADEVGKEVGVLKGAPYKIAFEYYSTSALPLASNVVEQMPHVNIDPTYVNDNFQPAHISAIHWYFTSMAWPAPPEYGCPDRKFCSDPDGNHTPSAAMSDAELRTFMQGQVMPVWYQRDGENTPNVADDSFSRLPGR